MARGNSHPCTGEKFNAAADNSSAREDIEEPGTFNTVPHYDANLGLNRSSTIQ